MNKARIHTVYTKADGMRVPSVTTVLSELAKPALIHWAWKLGIEGMDYKTFRDELADVGSLAHKMILMHLKREKLDQSDFTANQISLAENCFLKYLEWERQHKVEPIAIETPMVSEMLGFGGTPDFYGNVDDLSTLMDFKTGKGIYPEFWYQMAAYSQLVIENSKEAYQDVKKISNYRILNIGRDETENFVEEQRTSIHLEFEIFISTLRIYQVKKQIKNGIADA